MTTHPPRLSAAESLALLAAGRGALHLDRTAAGWYDRIDREELRLHLCDQCVLGQLYRSYSWGLAAVRPQDVLAVDMQRWAVMHGFYVSPLDREGQDALRKAWIHEIDLRFADQKG